jgi:hypothetical protein
MTSFDVSATPALLMKTEQHSGLPSKGDGESRGQAWRREMERAQMDTWLSHGVVGHTTSLGASLLSPAAVAAAASSAAPSEDAEVTARATSLSCGSGSPDPESLDTAQAAAGSSTSAPVGGSVERAHPSAPELDVSAATQGPLLPVVAVGRDTPSAEAISVLLQPLQPLQSVQSVQSTPPALGAANTVPANFTAASLGEVLQQFGAVEASTAPVPASSNPRQLPGPEAEKLRGASRSAPALTPLTLAAVQPIRVHADWSEDGVRLWLGMDASALASLEQITRQLQAWLNAQGVRLRSLSCNGQVLSQESKPSDLSDAPLVSVQSAGLKPYSASKEIP